MTNAEFIKKHGIREFRELNVVVYQTLFIAKNNKKIKSFKCSNKKKVAIVNLKDGKSLVLEYAQIAYNNYF